MTNWYKVIYPINYKYINYNFKNNSLKVYLILKNK